MALPVTITGISTAVAPVGPFKATNGNYYFFGRDSTTATTLQAYKSTAPDTSWASIATKTGFATGIQYLSAYQVGNVFHLVVTDGATTSINHKYQTFDATTDTFVTAETINSALNTQSSASANQYNTSIVVRSTGEVVVHTNVARISTFAQTAYRRRTGVATWAAAVAVSATGVNSTNPIVVLGTSDRLHFLWFNATNTMQCHLTSANVIGTSASTGATALPQDVATWDNAGVIRCVGLTATSVFRWNSADNPAVTNTAVTLGTPARVADTLGMFYALYQSSTDSDLYIKTCSDNGLTWSAAVSEFVGTVASADANLSKNQMIYTRGSAAIFPYLVNDNGTLKYDEGPTFLPAQNAWNFGDRSGGLLSNTDKTFTGNGVNYIRSTQSYANEVAGKYYAEYKIDTLTSTPSVGFKPLAATLASVTGSVDLFLTTGAVRISGSNSAVTVGAALATGDVACLAWNAGTEKIWFRKNNGLWNNDASADPATDTNGLDISATFGAGNAALWMRTGAAGDAVTVRTELAAFTQSPLPSGFTSWMGEALGSTTVTGNLVATEAADTAAFTVAAASPEITGNLIATEAADTSALNAAVVWQARLAATEAADTAALTSTVTWNAVLQATEAADAAAFAAASQWDARLIATEAADSAVFNATVFVTVTAELAATEARDAAAFTAATRTDAALNAIEAADSAALNASAAWTARLATIEAGDLATFDANLTLRANLAAIEAADTSALNAATQWNARLAATEAADIAALDADIIASGSLVTTEAADTAAFTAGIYATGRLLATEAADTSAIVGQIVGAGQTAWLTATETADAAALNAAVTGIVAAVGTIEAADLSALNATTAWAARLAAIEAADAASLNAATAWSARLAVTEAADTAALTGLATHAAALVATEAADSAAIYAGNGWFANLAAIEAADTAALNATIRLEARLAAIETADTSAINAGIYATGRLLAGEAADLSAMAATTAWNSTLAAIEAADTAAITATTRMEAHLATIEAADTAAINGRLGIVTRLAAIEAADSAALSANVTNVILGRLAATEASDRSAIIAYVPTAGKVYDTYTIVAHRKPATNIIAADVPMDLIAQQAASASRIARKTPNQNRDARK